MKKVWAIELDLLKTFSALCEKHNIKFQIFAGTLLGAVRHKGFIPWDDDLDVCMDRANFEKLLNIPKSEIHFPYFLQTAFTDRKFFCPYARFRNSETTAVITGHEDNDYNCGIYIDVFVLDGLVYSQWLQRIQFLFLDLIQMIISELSSKAKPPKTIVSATLRMMHPLLRIFGKERFFCLHQWASSWFNKWGDRISPITHGRSFANKYWMRKEDFSKTAMLPFENYLVPATANFEQVLSHIYGDYMTLPPQSERGKWHKGQIFFDPDISYKMHFEQMVKNNSHV